ncbi:MAG: hypothetical protein E6R03_14690 [Hyphomicrobiaceae bacterium]|nr:MAG: hypothetical protein E6R03_14690 [Hyphomicrobiaceae bacterium]
MATGTRTTYTDTTPQKRSIADMIGMIDWTEAPLLKLLGLNGESKFRLLNFPRTKVEWLEDTMAPRSGTVNEALDSSETGVDVATGQGDYLKAGDVILVDSELMYVSSVSTDTATVVRGFAGTTAASHSDQAAWKLATVARLEGADFTTGYTTSVTNPYNYTQIFSEAVKVTGSEQNDEKYGISDTMAYHISKLMGDGGKAGKLPILLQQAAYYGKRAAGSSTTARAMGGIEQYVTTNVTNLSSAALTRKSIEDLMQLCYLAGGAPNTLVCNAWARRKITSFYEGSIFTDRSEERGGSKITTIVTDFGDIEVVFDRWCPTDRLYLIEPAKMGWVTYRPFDVVDRASTGDYMVKDVLGEYSFVLMNETAHGYIYGASTSS